MLLTDPSQLCSCLRTTNESRRLHVMFRCVAAITCVLHGLGFLLLVFDQDNGKSVLFGASLLVPSCLFVLFFYVRSCKFKNHRRLSLLWIHGLFSICGLVCLTAIRDNNNFLQVSTAPSGLYSSNKISLM